MKKDIYGMNKINADINRWVKQIISDFVAEKGHEAHVKLYGEPHYYAGIVTTLRNRDGTEVNHYYKLRGLRERMAEFQAG